MLARRLFPRLKKMQKQKLTMQNKPLKLRIVSDTPSGEWVWQDPKHTPNSFFLPPHFFHHLYRVVNTPYFMKWATFIVIMLLGLPIISAHHTYRSWDYHHYSHPVVSTHTHTHTTTTHHTYVHRPVEHVRVVRYIQPIIIREPTYIHTSVYRPYYRYHGW